MRIAFIHISDFHFTNRERSVAERARKTVIAVRSAVSGEDVVPFLVVTGDLAFSGKEDEYGPIGVLLNEIREGAKVEFGTDLPIVIVPGNHDVDGPEKTLKELEDSISAFESDLDMLYGMEFEKSEAYRRFVQAYDIVPDEANGTFVKTFDLKVDKERVSVRAVMISSSPFSSLEKEQGRHYLPDAAIDSVALRQWSSATVPYNIVAVHHPLHWFDDETKLKLRRAFQSNADFLFMGHEHMTYASSSSTDGQTQTVVSQAGEYALDDWWKSSFSCVVLDTKTHGSTAIEFEWNPQDQLYVVRGSKNEGRIFAKGGGYRPRAEHLHLMQSDRMDIADSFLEYFEFPSLQIEDPLRETRAVKRRGHGGEEAIFDRIGNARIVNIVGPSYSGKTTLLRYLYLRSLDRGYVPLILDADSCVKSFKRSMANIVAQQYGETDYDRSRYQQTPIEKKLLFIDDFESVKKEGTAGEYLLRALEDVDTVVVVTAQSVLLDSEAQVNVELLNESSLCLVKMCGFTKSHRSALVSRICSITGVDTSMTDDICASIDHAVAEYHYMFPLNPGFVIQYLKYGLQQGNTASILARCAQPFGDVYQGNINNSLCDAKRCSDSVCSDALWAQLMMGILGEVAYAMHQGRSAEITRDDLSKEIERYLKEYEISGISISDVRTSMLESGILSPIGDADIYRFSSNSHLAFFVAKCICAKFGSDSDDKASFSEDLNRLLSEISYEINESVLLFMAFLQDNAIIPLEVCDRTEELLKDIAPVNDLEFAWNAGNLPSMVSDESRQMTDDAIERAEEKQSDSNLYEYYGPYDYSFDDEALSRRRVATAVKLMEMTGRMFSSKFMGIVGEKKSRISQSVYDSAHRAIGHIADTSLRRFDEGVDELIARLKEAGGDVPTREELRRLYSQMLMAGSLSLLDEVAFSISEGIVIDYMVNTPADDELARVFQLILQLHKPDQTAFCKLACKLAKDAKKHNRGSELAAIRMTTNVFMYNHPTLSQRLRYKLADQVFDESGADRKALLIRQRG